MRCHSVFSTHSPVLLSLRRSVVAMLKRAMGVLNDRERRIFEARRLSEDPVTLEDLSTEFDISRERVRQIEVRAFEKVQESVQKLALEQANAVRVIEDA